MINNSHQQKNKTGEKNDLEASHGKSKKIEVFVSPWMCYIIQFNERLHKIDQPRTNCCQLVALEVSERSRSLVLVVASRI